MNKHFRFFFLFFMFVFSLQQSLASDAVTLGDEEKQEAVEKMFSSPYTEEMYYRTDRLLLTATKRQLSIREAPAIATVVDADEIRNMGARNLTDILKMVPGIGVSINEHGVLMYEVRGIRTTLSEKVLVMIDGHPLNRNYVGSALAYVFDDLSVEKISRVEIIRGPGSALYGANAFLAVINIITKNVSDAEGTVVTATAGSFDTGKLNILSGKTFASGLQLFGSADYLKTDGYQPVIEQDMLSGTGFSQAPGSADTSLKKTDVFLKADYGDWSYEGLYIGKRRGPYVGFQYTLTDDNCWEIDNFSNEVSYRRAFSNRLNSLFKLYLDQFEQDARLDILPDGFPGFPEGMIGQPLLKDRTLGGELQLDYDITMDNHAIFGLMYEELRQFDVRHLTNFDPLTGAPLDSFQDISSWGNFNRNANREIWAAYLQDEWRLRKDLNLTAGLRYDKYSDFGDTANPRAAVVWSFSPDGELKLLYGKAFRAPNFVELYNANNPVIVGNPNLKPEEIQTYETGLTFRPTDRLTFNIDYFFSEIDNLIVWDSSTTPAEYVNRGRVEVDGVEVMLAGRYTLENYWDLVYTYQNPRDADTGQRLPNVPTHRAKLGANYKIYRYLSSHADLLWTGPRPRVTGDPRPDMPSYYTVDVALIGKNFVKDVEMRVSIHNLFNQAYSDPDTSGADQFVVDDFPREGIAAMVDLSYRF